MGEVAALDEEWLPIGLSEREGEAIPEIEASRIPFSRSSAWRRPNFSPRASSISGVMVFPVA